MELLCPNCQQKLTIPDQYAGQLMRCPLCNGTFTAPALAGVPAPMPVSPMPVSPTPSSPPAENLYTMAPATVPPPAPTWQPGPATDSPQGQSPPSPTEPPPPEPPPMPPGEYSRTMVWTLSDRVVSMLAPTGLGLVFILSFLPWAAFSFRGISGSLNGWTIGFGEHANAIIGIYLLITLLAFVLSVPAFLFARNLAPAPPFVKALGPWRSAIVGGVALLGFVFMIYTYLDAIFSAGGTPGTIWMKLAVRCHLIALIGSALEFWLEARRTRNLPPPRVELRW
ncbi:MAG: hypothetical protein FJ271_21945 [Planctomycetes bacterium]|nr:hypothetical protein [Planctomycetota bacterium]